LKKNFFVAIRPAQKCESPDFHMIWDNTFSPMYFLLRRVCHTSSSVSSLKSHLPSKTEFLTARSWIPTPDIFGTAYNIPLNHSIFLFLAIFLPKKSRSIIVEFVQNTFQQEEEGYHLQHHIREYWIKEYQSSSQR
jgi:hypothetical protein